MEIFQRECASRRRVRGSLENFVPRGILETAKLRRVQRTKQPKRSRGSGLLFASGLLPAQKKQGTATKRISVARLRAEIGPPWKGRQAFTFPFFWEAR